ncbi:MAG: hypothetical protein U0517_01710 [Candidatus Andersenbacteria bacterium]
MIKTLLLAQQYISPPSSVNLPGSSGGVTITTPIVNVINWGLAVAGGVAILVLIISGFLYVTAAGNERGLERAKTGIKGAITGIIIMLLAAIIVNTINFALTRGGGSGTSTPRTIFTP